MWFVVRVNISTSGQQQSSVQKFENETAAYKRYYNILAADIDNENYQYELCQIVRDDGICVASQVFDNRVEEVE